MWARVIACPRSEMRICKTRCTDRVLEITPSSPPRSDGARTRRGIRATRGRVASAYSKSALLASLAVCPGLRVSAVACARATRTHYNGRHGPSTIINLCAHRRRHGHHRAPSTATAGCGSHSDNGAVETGSTRRGCSRAWTGRWRRRGASRCKVLCKVRTTRPLPGHHRVRARHGAHGQIATP